MAFFFFLHFGTRIDQHIIGSFRVATGYPCYYQAQHHCPHEPSTEQSSITFSSCRVLSRVEKLPLY
jgi:hypothetical protein